MNNIPNNTLLRAIEVLEKAISENKPYTQVCSQLGFCGRTIRSVRKTLTKYVSENNLPYHYDVLFVNKFLQLCDIISNRDKASSTYNYTLNTQHKNVLNEDEGIDLERSKTWEDRDTSNKITKYNYHILIRDEDPFIGHLTTDQMEQIFANYPYVTRNTVSSYFPYLTFQQFKRLLRVFNITKDRLFPKHILENKSEDEIAEFALKAKEHSALKKYVEQKPLFVEKVLRDTQSELMELKDKRAWYNGIVKEVFENINDINKFSVTYSNNASEKALIIFLSDHIGASNNNAQFSKPYNKEVYYSRLKQILSEVRELKQDNKKFDKIIVMNLGDALDGWKAETTRGGHKLPQNMNDREQFKTYVESMVMFFQELHGFDLANNIEFVSVAESNHGGDAEYNANYALKYIFDFKFPDLKFKMFEKFVEHITYGEHTYIINHGKDNDKMIRNLPLHLDFKTELFFDNYIKHNKITSKYISVVKGDLHQYASEVGKKLKYTNIPSIYGGSTWTDANFGYTCPAFVYQVVSKYTNKITETYIELD
jgi:hypothetical protein